MKKIILILVSFFAVSAMAEDSYKLPITRDGVKTIRLAYNFWSGEYPGPMLKVGGGKKGKTTLQAYKSPRVLKDQVACTVKNGVYHPWGKTDNSIRLYYTIQALNEYQAVKDTAVNSEDLVQISIKAGDVINPVYWAEGSCGADYKGQVIGFSCDEVDSSADFKKISPDDDFFEEWLWVDCAEGYKAFIEADNDKMLNQKGVQEAELVEYGDVQ